MGRNATRQEVVALIKQGNDFAITCHRRPDGDALGSALGLAAILRALGKNVLLFHPDPIPHSLQFLTRGMDIAATPRAGDRFDATFVTDTAAAALLPKPFPAREVAGPIVILDHHLAAESVGDLILRDTEACSTGAVVWSLLHDLGLSKVPSDAAMPLYTSVVADTGGFRYPNTDATALRMGAELLEAGADPWTVAYNLFEGWAPERVSLLTEMLQKMERHFDGRLALLRVTQEMMARTGATDEMVDGLVDYGRGIRGVEVSALLWELERGPNGGALTKLSLRSRGVVDVSRVAQAFRGGGHRVAAAAEISQDLEAVKDSLEEMLGPVLTSLPLAKAP